MSTEQSVVKKLVSNILAAGYSVSVFDSYDNDGEWVLKRSKEKKAILSAMFSTGGDTLRIRDDDGQSFGVIVLVYGNASDGSEVIHDHTDNEVINKFVHSVII